MELIGEAGDDVDPDHGDALAADPRTAGQIRTGPVGATRDVATPARTAEARQTGDLARVADAIEIGVELIGIRQRAVVAGVSHPVAVGVELVDVGDARTVVARVPDTVAVRILLVGFSSAGQLSTNAGRLAGSSGKTSRLGWLAAS